MERKIAFVTGASNVTGKAIALALAKAGYNVGFTYTSNEDGAKKTLAAIEEAGGKGKYYYMNTRELDASIATLNSFCDEFGALDCMVNNTGITTVWKYLEVTPEQFDYLSEINIRGTYFMAQAAAKIMIKAGKKGHIINITSVHARQTMAHHTVYATTKAAIVRMTKSIAFELAPYGITVNAFAPGAVDMSSSDKYKDPAALAELREIQAAYAKYMPAGRWQTPEEIGDCIVFLASEASRYLIGETMFADGGVCLPMSFERDWDEKIAAEY